MVDRERTTGWRKRVRVHRVCETGKILFHPVADVVDLEEEDGDRSITKGIANISVLHWFREGLLCLNAQSEISEEQWCQIP